MFPKTCSWTSFCQQPPWWPFVRIQISDISRLLNFSDSKGISIFYIYLVCLLHGIPHRSANITITGRKENKNKNIKTSRASFEHFQHYIFMRILFSFFLQFHYLFKYVSRLNYFFTAQYE